MQEPDIPKSWVPTQSAVGGSIVGTALAQIVVAICDGYLTHPLTPEIASAVTTVCVFAAVYFIPDKPRS
jgi:hypothetical protein